MTERPDTWAEVPFGEINSFSDRSVDPSNSPAERFELYSVPAFPTHVPEFLLGAEIGSTKQAVRPNDVLVCKINPRINRVWQVMPVSTYRQIASSEWIVMRAEGLNPTFLRHYFSGPIFRDLICEGVTGVGGSLTRAQPKRVAQFPVPIAPLAEQKRIADKLDALFARVETCRERLHRAESILKHFRQSVLTAATSGELTREWREERAAEPAAIDLLSHIAAERVRRGLHSASRPLDHEGIEEPDDPLPDTWTWCRVGQVADVRLGGTPSRSQEDYWNGHIPWISSGEVANSRITNASEKITQLGLENSNAKVYPPGTVLIAMIGEGKTRGQSALLDICAATNQNVAGLVFESRLIEPEYVWYWALSEYERTRSIGRGGNQPALNGAKVRALPLPLPPTAEQRAIAERVRDLLSFADQAEHRLAIAFQAVKRLSPALLGKAFIGKLVSQDPNDGAASAFPAKLKAATSDISSIPPRNRARASVTRTQREPTGKNANKTRMLGVTEKL